MTDSRSPRDGRFIERIGSYNPLLAKTDEKRIVLDVERAKHWVSVGAQPTDRVARFLDAAGVKERAARSNPNKGGSGPEGQGSRLRTRLRRSPRPRKPPKRPRLLPRKPPGHLRPSLSRLSKRLPSKGRRCRGSTR